jgi:hypothetical protein
MKTTVLFSGLLILAFSMIHSLAVVAQYKPKSPNFGTDIDIYNDPDCISAETKISVAGNGVIYVLAKLEIPSVNAQGWFIWRSTDDGSIFSLITQNLFTKTEWTLADVDFVVTGNDPSNMRLWIAEVVNTGSTATNNSYCQVIELDSYGEFVGYRYTKDWGAPLNTLYNVSIATDFRSPGYAGDPFTMSIAYTGNLDFTDYLMYAYSLDGGGNWSDADIYSSFGTNVFGRVSLSLGATDTYNQGYYAVAFECNKTGDLGDIGVIMKHSNNDGLWISPVLVNQKVPLAVGKACYPSIALMDNVAANPANPDFIPVLIAYEDYGTTSEGINIMYNCLLDTYTMNTQATLENFSAMSIGGSNSKNELEPDVCFDKTYNNFLMTYFTSEGNNMPYIWINMDNLISGNWNFITYYRDVSTDAWGICPALDVNPANASACFSWAEQDPEDGHRSIVFDSEWSTVGIDNPPSSTVSFSLQPNPAHDKVTVNLPNQAIYEIIISDLTGHELIEQVINQNSNILNIEGLNPGIYFMSVSGDRKEGSQKLIVIK